MVQLEVESNCVFAKLNSFGRLNNSCSIFSEYNPPDNSIAFYSFIKNSDAEKVPVWSDTASRNIYHVLLDIERAGTPTKV